MKKKNVFVILVLAAVSLSVVLPVQADQPHMQAAKVDLNNALQSLRNATADKGGHRKRAMDLVSQAIIAVNKGIEYDRTHLTPVRRHRRDSDLDENSMLPVSTMPDQPNMVAAKTSLVAALDNLNRATADKGGYRQQAIILVGEAIKETNAGIEYDRKH